MNHPRPRSIAVAAMIAAFAVGLSGCGLGGAANPSESAGAKQIVIGTGAVPQTLDPILASDVQTDFTVAAMYDKLVDYDSTGKLEGRLATQWTYSDDAKTVTLDLRTDATFHSGNKVTATDVVYTLDRIASLGLGVSSFLTAYHSAAATDDHTVVITLSSTDTTFVGALSKVYVVDSALVEANAGTDKGQTWLASHDAGSGVYELDSYTPNQNASFTRWDGSWRKDDKRPATLRYQYISDTSTLKTEFTAGNVDLATGLTSADLTSLEGNSAVEMVSLPSYLQLYFMMNTAKGVTADVRVREAIQLAYDYDGHVSSILSGRGNVATGLVAPNLLCRYEAGPTTMDLDKAKALVEEAGATGATLTIAAQSIPEHAKAATLLQSQLKKIGLNAEIKTVTYPQYSAMVQSADTTPDIGVLWDFPYYPEIGPMLYRVYDSAFIDQTNYARYSNPKVDALLQSGVTSTDSASACADFTQAQQLILDDHVTVDVSNPTTTIATDKAVSGLEFAPTYQLFDPTQLVVAG